MREDGGAWFFFFFGRGVERWMWIETGRGERVRVEVFDFFELSEEWRRCGY